MTSDLFSLRLEPMSAAEFADYLQRQRLRFATAKAEVESLPLETVLPAANEQLARTLPQGRQTAGHTFVNLLSVPQHGAPVTVGEAWYWQHETPLGREGYLYDIFIHPEHRRAGHGRAALAAIEAALAQAGCRQLWLNVFASNTPARRFYEACGYSLGTLHLSKLLG
ncbi:MAG: GNAT family N-acetyltransferase [Pirellulales bacterium]